MLLAIDIGNSSIKFGVFDGPTLLNKFSIQTKRDYTVEELLFDRLKLHGDDFIQVDIDTCLVASVVPILNPVIAQVCWELFKTSAKFVDSTWPLGFKIGYEPPHATGADRLVNSYAAKAKYGSPVIVCSLGTATTIDVIDAKGDLVGGVIAPGMATNMKALHQLTAKLPEVSLEKTRSYIGRDTVSSIQVGVVWGHMEMLIGLINNISLELGYSPKVVLTGGLANVLAPEISAIGTIEENLTLDGLRLLSDVQT